MEDWKTTTGYHPAGVWAKAKQACRDFLESVARKGKTTYYTEVASSFSHILRKSADDPVFHAMLGQISADEHAEGRPLLSCICLHHDRWSVGNGFFEMAEAEGFDVSDKMKFWIDEMNKTLAYWKTV